MADQQSAALEAGKRYRVAYKTRVARLVTREPRRLEMEVKCREVVADCLGSAAGIVVLRIGSGLFGQQPVLLENVLEAELVSPETPLAGEKEFFVGGRSSWTEPISDE